MKTASSLTCHGCKHNWYSAPGGMRGDCPGRPAIKGLPHSRCSALGVDVPMILGPKRGGGDDGPWIGSEIPFGCPQHQQPGLF